MRSRKWMYMLVLGVLQMGIAIGCGGGSSDSNGNMSGGSQTGSSFSQERAADLQCKVHGGMSLGGVAPGRSRSLRRRFVRESGEQTRFIGLRRQLSGRSAGESWGPTGKHALAQARQRRR